MGFSPHPATLKAPIYRRFVNFKNKIQDPARACSHEQSRTKLSLIIGTVDQGRTGAIGHDSNDA